MAAELLERHDGCAANPDLGPVITHRGERRQSQLQSRVGAAIHDSLEGCPIGATWCYGSDRATVIHGSNGLLGLLRIGTVDNPISTHELHCRATWRRLHL